MKDIGVAFDYESLEQWEAEAFCLIRTEVESLRAKERDKKRRKK